MDVGIAQLVFDLAHATVLSRHLDLVHAGRRHRRHLGGRRALAIGRQPISAGADQEVGAELARLAEQLVDVALTVTDMHPPIARAPRQDRQLEPFGLWNRWCSKPVFCGGEVA